MLKIIKKSTYETKERLIKILLVEKHRLSFDLAQEKVMNSKEAKLYIKKLNNLFNALALVTSISIPLLILIFLLKI